MLQNVTHGVGLIVAVGLQEWGAEGDIWVQDGGRGIISLYSITDLSVCAERTALNIYITLQERSILRS
jgi:hypothetical protein